MVDVPLRLPFHFASVKPFAGKLFPSDLNVSSGQGRDRICTSESGHTTTSNTTGQGQRFVISKARDESQPGAETGMVELAFSALFQGQVGQCR